MFDAIYVGFFWILVAEIVVFLLLTMPSPRGFKGKFINFLSTNTIIGKLMIVHLLLCALAIFFYVDLSQSQQFFNSQKQRLKVDVSRHIGTQLRLGYLSYTVLKIQRNKYITFMLVYVSIAFNIYVQLLRYIYRKREKLQALGLLPKIQKKQSDKLQPHEIEVRSSADRNSNQRSSTNRDSNTEVKKDV